MLPSPSRAAALLAVAMVFAGHHSDCASGGGTASKHVHRRTLPPQIAAKYPTLLAAVGQHHRADRATSGGAGAVCTATEAQQALMNATGRLSIKATGAVGDKQADDGPALVRALALAKACGSAEVYLPPGHYLINSTVHMPSGMTIAGTATGGMETPAAILYGPVDHSPILMINRTMNVVLRNLQLEGGGLAVHIFDAAGVRFEGVGVSASVNVDKVDASAAGCDGCNVRLGSMNAAMVIENSFWLWFENTAFRFMTGPLDSPDTYGQRPVIIMRGKKPEHTMYGLSDVYLVVFKDSEIDGGGIQYQATTEAGGDATGFWDFFNVVLEDSACALLDIQSDPAVQHFYGVEEVTIIDYVDADPLPAHFAGGLQNLTSVLQLNCSQPMCALDGITMMAASPLGAAFNGYHIGHAVRVFAGAVRSITMLDSGHTGGLAVVDAAGVPFGSFVSKSAGGFVFLGEAAPAGMASDATLLPNAQSPNGNMTQPRGSSHALLLGLSGETKGRMAIEADGSMRFGDGSGDFDTTMHRQRTAKVAWDPPKLEAGSAVSQRVPVPGAAPGDIATASHTGVTGEELVQLSANAVVGAVVVVLRNAGGSAVDLASGDLRVSCATFS